MWNQYRPAVEEVWPEAAGIDGALVDRLLSVANALCVAYAPVLPEGAEVPDNYRVAEALQARDLWSKLKGGNAETYGMDGQEIPVYPLVMTVRSLLRPKSSPLSRLR